MTNYQEALVRAASKGLSIRVHYTNGQGEGSERVLRDISYPGVGRDFSAWCELREEVRHFRLDRVQDLEILYRR